MNKPEVKTATPTFKTFRTLKLGTGIMDAYDFRQALKKDGCLIDALGDDILGKSTFKAAKAKMEVELVVVSVGELGFKKNGAWCADIYKRASELNLELCPHEVGPQLRLQYKDQPKGECLYVAMRPITNSVGDNDVFVVERYDDDDERRLSAYFGGPSDYSYTDSLWVFLRRK